MQRRNCRSCGRRWIEVGKKGLVQIKQTAKRLAGSYLLAVFTVLAEFINNKDRISEK